jgi:glucan phosphoethanolaminetransferase (alkaline phosphatase superfamily)
MRTGLPKNDIPCLDNKIHYLPTIWQYAKFANFKSILIDTRYKYAQGQQEYMTAEETLQIDEYISILDRPYFRREILAADKLLEILKRDEAMFIYVNKWGSHQPYDINFPPDLAFDPTNLVNSLDLPKLKQEAIRDYHKAIKFCVDEFFQKVIPEISDDAVLIYTSDHGEALYDGNYDTGHCGVTPVLGEGQVPMIAVTPSRDLSNQFKEEAHRAHNHASHFEIFPTILELMGYSRDWIENRYGNSLLHISIAQKRSFYAGDVFSSKGRWTGSGD